MCIPLSLLGNGSVHTFPRQRIHEIKKNLWTFRFLYCRCSIKGKSVVLSVCVEAGSNTSTVTLRVGGGDEKGSLKFETVNFGHEVQWTRTQERLRWRGPAAYTKDRPVLSSERAPHKNKTVTVSSPRWGSTPRLTNWLTVSRNVTLTLTLTLTLYPPVEI
jgi:hypothetical protein